MRTMKSLLAAILAVVMIACMSISAFAVYEETKYDDVDEMYGTTQDSVNILQIRFVDKLGIIPAYHNGSFNPAGLITRGEALKIAYRMLHYNYDELANYSSVETPFDEMGGGDISDTNLLKPYIAWALDYGLISGDFVPENKFETEKNITGAEFMTLIAKIIGTYTGEGEEGELLSEDILYGSNLTTDSETVNREQAAVVVARAMIYDADLGEVSDDMFTTFEDFEGNRIKALATEVYGCNFTSLAVRATKNRPMNYENVNSDVLLSNGVQVDIGADLSDFVGYHIDVIYLDKDASDTFTEGEDIITYEITSPIVSKVNLNELEVVNFTELKATTSTSTVKIYSQTQLYLNDQLWPKDEIYNLVKQVSSINFTAPIKITGRPNMELTFIQQGSTDNAETVFATEWIPGKIMTVTDNYISVYSYYDGKTYVYDDNDAVMTKIANPTGGDYVNFYTAGKKIYITAGTVAELDGASGLNKWTPHTYVNTPTISTKEMQGTLIAVLDITEGTYLALEEKRASKDVAVEVLSVLPDEEGAMAEIEVRELVSGKEYTLTTAISRIYSKTGVIDAGSIFTYYKTAGKNIVMNGVDPIETNVIEADEYFIVSGEKKLLKTDDFVSESTKPLNGKAILYVDAFGGVWAAKAA